MKTKLLSACTRKGLEASCTQLYLLRPMLLPRKGGELSRTHHQVAHTCLYSFDGGFQSQLLHSSPCLGYAVGACSLAGHLWWWFFPEIWRELRKVNSMSFGLFEPLLKCVTWRGLAAYPQPSQPETPHSNSGDLDAPAWHPFEYLQNLFVEI